MHKPFVWVALGITIAVSGCSQSSSRQTAPPPITIRIANNDAKEIKASSYLDYKFTLPSGACDVRGKIEGVTGGQKDFEAFIMNDENFQNWKANLSAQGIQSGRKVVWSFDENVVGGSDWHLVVSNTFSLLTSKAVTVSAEAVCRRSA